MNEIVTEEQYNYALKTIEWLMNQLDFWVKLVEDYEDIHYPINESQEKE